jgi:hypothetical protein
MRPPTEEELAAAVAELNRVLGLNDDPPPFVANPDNDETENGGDAITYPKTPA